MLSLVGFPAAYKMALRHENLLILMYTPRVWRFLIQSFPGIEFIAQQAYGPFHVPTAMRSMEVEEPPGMGALLSDFGNVMSGERGEIIVEMV